MLTLRNSPNSPFGRKVVVALELLDMNDKVVFEAADTGSASDTLRQQNPLGKIPTLVLETGDALYDSRVILEYLNDLDGQNRLIPTGEAKFPVLRLQALADGIMDAAILKVYEVRFRPEAMHVQAWLDHQQGKIDRGLFEAEKEAERYSIAAASAPNQAPKFPNVGEIALACALGYFNFRFGTSWQNKHPKLAKWFELFEHQHTRFARSAPGQ